MIDLLNTRAAQIVAGGLTLSVVACGVYIFLHYSGYLSALVVVNLTIGCVALWVWVIVKIKRSYHAPQVVYDKAGGRIVRMVDAQVLPHALYPASLTSLTTHYDPRINTSAPEAPAAVDAAPGLPRAEPFYRICEQIEPGRMILGYNLAGAITGDITDLLSTAIVGRPGTGKTTALRFVCAQVLKIGGRPLLFDPHGSIADEVEDVLECAEDTSSIARLAARLEQELDQRLAARREKHPIGAPMLVLADEWPVIAQIAPEAVRITGRVILEGRKVGVYALVSGQGLPAEHLGGSLFRDALSSRYIFCTTPAQARLAGMDNETAKSLIERLETAGPGYAILASARRRPEIVAIPDTRPNDLRALVGTFTLPPLPPNPYFAFSRAEENTPAAPKTPLVSASEKAKNEVLSWYARGVTKPHVIARKMGRASSYAEDVKQILREEGLI